MQLTAQTLWTRDGRKGAKRILSCATLLSAAINCAAPSMQIRPSGAEERAKPETAESLSAFSAIWQVSPQWEKRRERDDFSRDLIVFSAVGFLCRYARLLITNFIFFKSFNASCGGGDAPRNAGKASFSHGNTWSFDRNAWSFADMYMPAALHVHIAAP